tara:strand:- start:329 stop:1123 length:795 start_codon:yes stop_codon:yes gene_type:complete
MNLKKNIYDKKIRIGIIISCRLKSTRLPNKAILKIGKISSIERCINQVKKSNFKSIVLATSSLEKSKILDKIAKKKNIHFFRGSDKDLILRNLEVSNEMGYEHIVRVTGDSPLVSYELINEITKYHINMKSDYTYNENLPLGTRCEVVAVEALKKIYDNTVTHKYGEYLSLYFQNNKKYLKINKFDLDFPKKFKNIRLNLDYKTDLNYIKKLLFFYKNKKIISLQNILKYLELFHKENIYIKSKYNKTNMFNKILKDSKFKNGK